MNLYSSLCFVPPSNFTQNPIAFDSSHFYFAENITSHSITFYSVPLQNLSGGSWLTPPVCPIVKIVEIKGDSLLLMKSNGQVLVGVVLSDQDFVLFTFNLKTAQFNSTILTAFDPSFPFDFDPNLDYLVYASTNGAIQSFYR